MGNYNWKGNSTISHPRNMCLQDYYTVSFLFICRTLSVIKTYLTIEDKFFIPGLIHYLWLYIKGCHFCQPSRNDKLPVKQLQTRINLNYRSLSRLSMDLKVMVTSYKGHKFILCIIDEVTNYLITVPIHQSTLEEIGDTFIENVISKYWVPDYLIMDQGSAFMSSFMNYLTINH